MIVAPAGAGKSVLARSWLEYSRPDERVAWVSVKRTERDDQRFWLSITRELRGSPAGDVVSRLAPTPDFDGETAVEGLLEQIASLKDEVLLVIDDVHELVGEEILGQLTLFLSALPASLGVLLLMRQDMPLGLHRLRLAGELSELREEDLRFSLSEAHELMLASGVSLPDNEVAQLQERTEGWGTGLRLAAMLLAGHAEPERVVAEFSGNERTVAAYLLAEVLNRQPEEVKRLLLRTSILETVTAPLADALTGTTGAERILRDLEEAGAFVLSLDDERTAFRYHQLFADMLRLELRRRHPEDVTALHMAAARWLVAEGRLVEAIGHAQSAGDWGLAASVLADGMYGLWLGGQEDTIHDLLAAFPPHEVTTHPELAIVFAGDQLARGSLADAEAHIAVAERHAGGVAEERRHHFEVGLAVARLSLARRRGDFASVLAEVNPLLEPIKAETHGDIALNNDLRALALMNLGIAETWSAGYEESKSHLREGAELARQISRPYVEVTCLAHTAVTVHRRSFTGTEQVCMEALAAAEARGWGTAPVVAPALASFGSALVMTGRFEEGEIWLDRAEQALRWEVEPAVALMLFAARGALEHARGRLEQALAAYGAVDRMQTLLATGHPLALQIRSARLQIRLRLGEVEAVREALTDLDDEERDSGPTREALAALALTDEEPESAIAIVAPMVDGSAPLHHRGVVVRAHLLDAAARSQLGDSSGVTAALERALDTAEPDRLVMPFMVHPSARTLLEHHPSHQSAHGEFLQTIQDVFRGVDVSPTLGRQVPLDDPLSDAELRVLRYLPSNLSAIEIAAELYLSVHTVKTHMRHIYAKLDAHTRGEAVRRAREGGLLTPSARR